MRNAVFMPLRENVFQASMLVLSVRRLVIGVYGWIVEVTVEVKSLTMSSYSIQTSIQRKRFRL